MGGLAELALALTLTGLLASGSLTFLRGALGLLDSQRRVAAYVAAEVDLRTCVQQLVERAVTVTLHPSLATALDGSASAVMSGGSASAIRLQFVGGAGVAGAETGSAAIALNGGELRYVNAGGAAWTISRGVTDVSYAITGGVLVLRVTRAGAIHEIWTAAR